MSMAINFELIVPSSPIGAKRPFMRQVATTKLAVDRQIEHGEVASATFDLKRLPDRPDVLGS
jgi:hypothetical protein